jgi:hypothetical protein
MASFAVTRPRDPQFDRPHQLCSGSSRSAPRYGREPFRPRWEGHEAPAGGMTPAPAPGGQEALQVLTRGDQQALDIGVEQASQSEPT